MGVQEDALFLKEDAYVPLGDASFPQRDAWMDSVMLASCNELPVFPMDMLVCPREVLGYTKEMPGLCRKISVFPERCPQWVHSGGAGVTQEDAWNLRGCSWMPREDSRVLQGGS